MRNDEPETGSPEAVADVAAARLATDGPSERRPDAATAGPVEPTPEEPAAGLSPVAAFFDVDNTIIRGASSFHLAMGLYRRGFFRKRDIVNFFFQQARYLAFGESRQQIDEVRSRALHLMTGHSVAEVVAIGEEVYDQVLALRIFPGTQRLLDAHLSAGHQVWLVTATPVEIGDLIARRLGADGALGTVAEHDDGFYTGRLVGDMMHGQAKADAVLALAERLGLDLAASSAYGDSMNDVPLLSTVGNPCPINPDPRLRRHAKTVGWPVREFRGRRRAAKRGLKTASWAGVAWAGGLVARSAARSATRTLRRRFGA
nr:HAD-IB family hydrolase [Sanguibacter suaedae]